MNQKQINQLEMFLSTDAYLDGNATIWGAIPIITQYKNQLSQLLDGIRASAQDQEAAQVFVGASLQQAKHLIAEKMDILDDVLEAYADDTEDAALLSQVSNSKTDYLRLPHGDFEVKTKNVIELLETHVDEMLDYGLSVDQIDDVKLSFGVFQDMRGQPRSFQIASRVATQNLEDLFIRGKIALSRLDRVMKRFKRSNSTFYYGYQAARTVVNN